MARALYAVLDDQRTEKAEFVVLLDDPLSAVDPEVRFNRKGMKVIFSVFIFKDSIHYIFIFNFSNYLYV